MRSLEGRLILAFAAVALVSIAAVAALTGAAIRAEFDRYFFGMPMMEPPAPGGVAPRSQAPPRMPHMTDPEAMRTMMRRVMGTPEVRFLAQLRRATWQAAMAGVLAAVLLGIVVARYMIAPLRQMSTAAARVGRGDLAHEVPVPSDDELGNLARAFNAMTADLRRLEESRRHLVADIAHELGTPLSVLQANLEGMLDGVVEVTPDRLAALHTQVGLLARLVDDLRDLSLAQAGRLVLTRAPTDLAVLVADAVAVVQPHANEKGVDIRSRLAPGLPPVSVDRDRIMQVVHNLLDNAIRHTPAGGTVTVGLEAADPEVRLTVSDTGPGIPPEAAERVFDRFYRLDASRARASGGAGLGLAIVKSLVEAHGGRVWVASRMGEGSTFAVALPLRA
ncbi:MAG: ATP-binding protein [Armatimonadota bacterium]|nr:ATP-binding protein [Armatimonadota bacterium]MDR7518615.1 ATP-binding protein [Armatimonadota bacterium]MDR7548482.1 ATP-binding protein [Armatimonadota bacterium]